MKFQQYSIPHRIYPTDEEMGARIKAGIRALPGVRARPDAMAERSGLPCWWGRRRISAQNNRQACLEAEDYHLIFATDGVDATEVMQRCGRMSS